VGGAAAGDNTLLFPYPNPKGAEITVGKQTHGMQRHRKSNGEFDSCPSV
jgi:hypothetical protein